LARKKTVMQMAEFNKRGQLLIRTHNETLPVTAMPVSNPDRLAVGLNGCDAAPTSTGFAEIVSDDGCRWFVNEAYLGTPVPVRGTACGLAPPSSTIFRDACRSPLAPGVKVTSIVQLPPGASLDRHVVVSAKSPKFAPLMPTPEICKSSLLTFVTVAVRGSLVVPTT
jgi:hypothetical protein